MGGDTPALSIDSHGEIQVILINDSPEDFVISVGWSNSAVPFAAVKALDRQGHEDLDRQANRWAEQRVRIR